MGHDALIDALSGTVDTWSDGTVVYRNAVGQPHRTDGPAVIYPSGTRAWYQNGVLHRLDGPAVIYSNGTERWYQNGLRLSEEEFNQRIASGEYRDP